MRVMFKFLFFAHLGITALMLFSWGSLFFLPANAHDAQVSNKMDTGYITLLFCAIAGIVWYFQKTEHFRAASFVLYGFYVAALCWLLWVMKNSTWH